MGTFKPDTADAHNLAVLHRRIADLYERGTVDAAATATTITNVLATASITSERVHAAIAIAVEALQD